MNQPDRFDPTPLPHCPRNLPTREDRHVTTLDSTIVAQLDAAFNEIKDEYVAEDYIGHTYGEIYRIAMRDHRVCARLVAAAQQGDKLCGLLTLKLLLPHLKQFAHRRGRRFSLEESIGVAWIKIMTIPLHRLHHDVLANLKLDVLKVLTRQHRKECLDKPLARVSEHSRIELFQAKTLIETGVELELINDQTAKVLSAFYLEGYSGREVAKRHNLSETTVRYRCSAGSRKLRENSALLLQAA